MLKLILCPAKLAGGINKDPSVWLGRTLSNFHVSFQRILKMTLPCLTTTSIITTTSADALSYDENISVPKQKCFKLKLELDRGRRLSMNDPTFPKS